MKLDALQQAIYDRLTGDDALMSEAVAVWAPKAPQADDGELAGPFPYVVLPQVTASPFDTDGTLGGEVVVQVDGYSRSRSDLSIKRLHGLVYGALHRQPLAITGAAWVDTLHESTVDGYEDEGKTRRFVALYRVTYELT